MRTRMPPGGCTIPGTDDRSHSGHPRRSQAEYEPDRTADATLHAHRQDTGPTRPPSNVIETSDISINSPGASLVALHGPSPDRWSARRSSILRMTAAGRRLYPTRDILESLPNPERFSHSR